MILRSRVLTWWRHERAMRRHPAEASRINGQEFAGGACSKTLARRKSGATQSGVSSGILNLSVGTGALINSALGAWSTFPELMNVTAQE